MLLPRNLHLFIRQPLIQAYTDEMVVVSYISNIEENQVEVIGQIQFNLDKLYFLTAVRERANSAEVKGDSSEYQT